METDPNTWAQLVHALSSLDTGMRWMLFVVFMSWLTVWRGFAWWDTRCERKAKVVEDEKAAEVALAKDARDQAFIETMNHLASVLSQHTADEENNASRINNTLMRFTDLVGELRRSVGEVHARMSNKTSKRDSLAAIEDQLTVLRHEVCNLFAKSLLENDYAARSEFIRTRVKTGIGDVFDRAKHRLTTDYDLSVPVDPFFAVRDGAEGNTRYTAVDELWDWVEPLYRSKTPVTERIEEMCVMVGNVINDVVSRGRERLRVFDSSGG